MLKKFLVSYILLCLLPFIALGLIVSRISSNVIREELLNAAQATLEESARSINNLAEDAKQILLEFSNNETIQGHLRACADPPASPEDLLRLDADVGKYPLYGKTYMSIRLYLPDADGLDGAQISQIGAVGADADLAEALAQPGHFLWTAHAQENLTTLRVSKAIFDTQDWSETRGVACIDISLQAISNISAAASSNGQWLYLVDGTGALVYPIYNYDRIPAEILSGPDQVTDVGDKILITKSLEMSGWKLIKTVSMQQINEKISNTKRSILAVALLFMVLSLFAAVYFTKEISQPITRLAAKMKGARAGALTPIADIDDNAEIGQLYKSYNYMTTRLRCQIDETYALKLREKDADLRALQAQINPHFLYNVLDSINWMALRYKAQDISDIVIALSDMLRFSLNKGRNSITVRDELRQVDSYIRLQKIRFSSKFDVRYDIDPAAEDCRIIKMLLQPIVENAILHGFEEMDGGGLIVICVRLGGTDEILFEVRNNGAPIDLDKMREKLTSDEETPHGYGIRNVNDRLKNYGPGHGIVYSLENGFTVARFSVPREAQDV
ncbi:MAG: sensor histidine kinase [Oscillospiraceae bacterium]|nr:sensor histidine kinase [Oscillospiraceae bacterium]